MPTSQYNDNTKRRRRWLIAALVLGYIALILFVGGGSWRKLGSVQASYYSTTLLDLLLILVAGGGALAAAGMIGTRTAFVCVVLGGIGITFAAFDLGRLFHPHGNGPLSNLALLQTTLAAFSVGAGALGLGGVIFRKG